MIEEKRDLYQEQEAQKARKAESLMDEIRSYISSLTNIDPVSIIYTTIEELETTVQELTTLVTRCKVIYELKPPEELDTNVKELENANLNQLFDQYNQRFQEVKIMLVEYNHHLQELKTELDSIKIKELQKLHFKAKLQHPLLLKSLTQFNKKLHQAQPNQVAPILLDIVKQLHPLSLDTHFTYDLDNFKEFLTEKDLKHIQKQIANLAVDFQNFEFKYLGFARDDFKLTIDAELHEKITKDPFCLLFTEPNTFKAYLISLCEAPNSPHPSPDRPAAAAFTTPPSGLSAIPRRITVEDGPIEWAKAYPRDIPEPNVETIDQTSKTTLTQQYKELYTYCLNALYNKVLGPTPKLVKDRGVIKRGVIKTRLYSHL